MSKTIWKYEVSGPLDVQLLVDTAPGPIVHAEVKMPVVSSVSVKITIWVEVEFLYANVTIPRAFQIFGTWHRIPDGAVHVLTWRDDWFVGHLMSLEKART